MSAAPDPMHPPHIAIIAGEVSGDMLGADLIAALKERLGSNITLSGVGSDHMERQGFKSLFPMQEIALMGFAEIIPHLFQIKLRIKQTIETLRNNPPDILITIDSPGFTFRVAKALADIPCKKVHYVAPTVWAYKPERAEKTAATFDHLLTLLPFEPPYFEKEGLRTNFIGHPTIWRNKNITREEKQEDMPTLALLPGSRRGELKRHLPVFRETVACLKQQLPNLTCIMPLPAHLAEEVSQQIAGWKVPVHIISDESEKMTALAGATAALAKSGTVSLELACSQLPTVTTYKAHPISAFLIRRMMKTEYVNLVNIIAGKRIIPEHLQEECNAETLAASLLPLLTDEQTRAKQIAEFETILNALGKNEPHSPSEKAAEIIAEYLP